MIARKKRILLLVILAVLILSVVFGIIYAIVYFKTDVLMTDQDIFYKYISKNEDIINVIDDNWLNAYKNKISTTTYNNSGEITFNIDDENNESQLNTMMNNIKISFEGSTDLSNKQSYQDIKLLYSDDNKELFNVKFLMQDQLYGLKTDEIVTKYVSVKNENINELYNRLGMENSYNLANKLEKYDFNLILNMPEKKKNEINKRYMNVLNAHVKKSNFSIEKGARVTANNEVYKANKYSMKLTGDELVTIRIKLLETLFNDDEILNEVIKLLQKDDKYKTIIKGEIQEAIEDIRRQPANQNIALELYVYEADGNVVKTECITENRNISIENVNTGNNQKVVILDTETNKGVIVTTYTIVRNTSNDNNSLSFNINSTENGRQALELSVDIINSGNINSDNIETNMKINIKDDTGKKSMEYINKKQFNVATQIESLNDNTVTLNNTTIEYNKNIIKAIQDRLAVIYDERAKSVGLDSKTLTSEIQYAIKNMRQKFNRDEFEKQVQRSLNYVKQDAVVDLEYIEELQKAKTSEELQKIKARRLTKRLNEFGINAVTDEENGRILIDSGYNYNYVYYIDYEKYTVTRAE